MPKTLHRKTTKSATRWSTQGQGAVVWGDEEEGVVMSTLRRRAVKPPSPAIFLEAARRIAHRENTYACVALESTAADKHRSGVTELAFMTNILCPPDVDPNDPWYGWDASPTDQMARSLGLLLCAELAREGFTP